MPMKLITVNDLPGLPVAERLRLVEDLWDCIAEALEAIELSEAQCTELDRKLAAYHNDPESGSPWSEVKDRILKRMKYKLILRKGAEADINDACH